MAEHEQTVKGVGTGIIQSWLIEKWFGYLR